MILEQQISFEVAKAAYEAGFYKSSKEYGEVHGGWYNELGMYLGRIDIDRNGVDLKIRYPTLNYEKRKKYYLKSYYAPSQSILHRWLREEKNIHLTFSCHFKTVKPYYEWFIQSEVGSISQVVSHCFTYEEAMNQGLLKALELVKKWPLCP